MTHYIINLSSIITYKIQKPRAEIANLCNQYAKPMWPLSWCFPYFTEHFPFSNISSWATLIWLWYLEKNAPEIAHYKLGKLDTQAFMDKLLEDKFRFLLETAYSEEMVQELSAGNEDHIIQVDENEQDQSIIAKALVERAWTSGVSIEAIDREKIQHFLELAKDGHSIYFIANTNHMDIYRIFCLLEKNFKEQGLLVSEDFYDQIDGSGQRIKQQEIALKITDNIYLSASYLCGVFKTEVENQAKMHARLTALLTAALVTVLGMALTHTWSPMLTIPLILALSFALMAVMMRAASVPTTPALTTQVIHQMLKEGADLHTIHAISQYSKDLEVVRANFQDLPSNNLHKAADYYKEHLQIEGPKELNYCAVM